MQIHDLDRIARELQAVPGDCAEFGCFEGESTIQIANAFKPRRVWAWDTFSGMPDDGYIPSLDSSDPPGKWAPKNNPLMVFAKSGLDIIPIVGKYSFTIPRFVDDECALCHNKTVTKFAFVHIDCDHYEAYKRVFAFVTPRMSPKGLVRLDDLGCPGAKKATEEYLQATGKVLNGDWIRF